MTEIIINDVYDKYASNRGKMAIYFFCCHNKNDNDGTRSWRLCFGSSTSM